MRNEPPAQPNQGLMDGLTVLQEIASRREPMSGKELAAELDLEVTKVNRLLKTLAYMGIVYRTNDRRYASGPGMHVLAAQSLFASGLIQRALPQLEELSRLGLTVAMGVLWREHVSYLYHGSPGMGTAEALGRSALFPATKSSIGMALLARRPEDEVRSLYRGREIPGFAGVRDLAGELRATRERGYAVVPIQGGSTVGVTYGEPAYAGVAVAGAIPKREMPACVEALRETVARIEQKEAVDVQQSQ